MPRLCLFGRTVRHPVRKPKLATLHETQGDSRSQDSKSSSNAGTLCCRNLLISSRALRF